MAVIHHCPCRPLLHTLFSSTTTRTLGRVWPRSFSHTQTTPPPPPFSSSSLQPNTPTRILSNVEQIGVGSNVLGAKVSVLKQKMELLGINSHDFLIPGRFHHFFCPKCKGGQSMIRTLSLHIIQDGGFAMWRCFHNECQWIGQVFADDRAAYNGFGKKVESFGQISEESLGLEPLGSELIAYFADRMISEKTLQRNAVMQLSSQKNVIALTYRQNGLLVGCKYRTTGKRFWQEKGTEKILYGLDDINDVAEIIIVEGEIDKLSLEEAGLRNCVSVPNGAPAKVSTKGLSSVQKFDLQFQYLWNCKENLDKVSRIILATDGDTPGKALAEELACRLGKERCWKVRWPKKDDSCYFKDANEVLKHMGPVALKKVIEDAELYQPNIVNQVM
ncbi:primase homolog protein [Quercus suber]|uniref:primase homolog protein n=1 Tax=Quercus suber TaxID=58331 RepID=UPI000CE1CCCF|nr:primase homolog protein-like isoform X1 [Quercus suber]POE96701.1 twinkle like protein, chloroplastic/mitochondrial [Quercus suber]